MCLSVSTESYKFIQCKCYIMLLRMLPSTKLLWQGQMASKAPRAQQKRLRALKAWHELLKPNNGAGIASISGRAYLMQAYECQCTTGMPLKNECESASHLHRLQRLRHGSAHWPGCLMVRVTVRWCGRLVVRPEARWRPRKVRSRRTLTPIDADKIFRVCEGLLSNLQRNAREAGQVRNEKPERLVKP